MGVSLVLIHYYQVSSYAVIEQFTYKRLKTITDNKIVNFVKSIANRIKSMFAAPSMPVFSYSFA